MSQFLSSPPQIVFVPRIDIVEIIHTPDILYADMVQ